MLSNTEQGQLKEGTFITYFLEPSCPGSEILIVNNSAGWPIWEKDTFHWSWSLNPERVHI